MKLYLIYAKIPKNIYNDMKTRGTIFANEYEYINGDIVFLYAWTNKKRLLNGFMNIHKSGLFTVIKKEFYDKDECDEFTLKYVDDKLMEMVLRSSNGDNVIIGTRDEYSNLRDSFSMFKFELLSEHATVNYTLFKSKYQIALDKLGYTTDYEYNFGDDIDFVSNNDSYNVTVLGNQKHECCDDEVGLYAMLYKYLLK